MASDGPANRKRPHAGAGGAGGTAAPTAQERKRRQIEQAEWGLKEVLGECGLLEFASGNGNNDNPDLPPSASPSELGCRLEPSVSPSGLRASLSALLAEMDSNGIDQGNERVRGQLGEWILGTGEEGDDNAGGDAGNGGNLLRKMLLPLYRVRTRGQVGFSQFSQPECDENGNATKVTVESSSLVKVLLRVDALQSSLLTALLQKLPEIASRFGAEGVGQQSEDVPRLIFSNIRWLDHVVDYSSLTTAFVECLTVLASSSADCTKTRGMLLDALTTLPDVLNDANALSVASSGDGDEEEGGGSDVLAALTNLRTEDPSLLVPVLDAVGSLPLTEGQIEEVTRDALEALANVEPWGLPALTTFLMTNCPHGGRFAREVVEEMRKLPLGGADGGDGDDEEDRMDADRGSGNGNDAGVMIDSLSRGLAHRPDLASTLLKAVKETREDDVHPPADLWLLACVATAQHNRPKVKSLVKAKATAGRFDSRWLRSSLAGNGKALGSLFATLCDLADGLLRSSADSHSAPCALGVTLYEVLFEEFGEPMQRQEIIGGLVTHVGSGMAGVKSGGSGEADAALRVFCNIVDQEDGATALRSFTPFLVSMLDHIHRMNPSQVRRLFLLLFAVGLGSDEGERGMGAAGPVGGSRTGGGACSDVHIVITKHLTLASFAKKRIGIIGTVAYAVARSSQLLERQSIIDEENALAETEATTLPGNAAVAQSPIVGEVTEMIEKALEACKPPGGSAGSGNNGMTSSLSNAFSDGSAMAFLLDELCRAVRGGRLADPIKEWLNEKFQQEFEETFVGDFVENEDEDDVPLKGTKGSKGAMVDVEHVPTNSQDLALLNGSSGDKVPGQLRFSIDGAENVVYVRLLPLLLSQDHTTREILPVTLAPMFRLMGVLSDVRYGGKGLSEIDAMLDCPLLLPDSECSGLEFTELSSREQWVATSSYYFATCWVRQLINSFIYAADECAGAPSAPTAGSFTASSQGFNSDEVRKKVVARLEALVELEEELRFTSSKCFSFAPPGLDVLPAPKELYGGHDNPNDDEENAINLNEDTSSMTKAEKKAYKAAKKEAAKRAKEKVKSKQNRIKARKKHEEKLVTRALGALRPLDPRVCVALGFDELGVVGSAEGDSQSASQGLSQSMLREAVSVGGPVTTLLLKLLRKTLSDALSEKKGLSFRARIEGSNLDEDADDDDDGPYMAKAESPATNSFTDLALASVEESSKKAFELLDVLLRGGVFASLYEHLAAVAELRCGPNRTNNDPETEGRLVATARCLFGCVSSLMGSELLTRSTSGKMFLAAILKQIAEGDTDDYTANANKRRRRPSPDAMNKLLGFVCDVVVEIVSGAYTSDVEFAMDAVNCMQVISECSKRISVAQKEDGDSHGFPAKLSKVASTLLKQDWPDDTKLNKSNVGKLLSLLLEHAPNRMETLTNFVNDVLPEVPHLDKNAGVPAFPTCSHQTFGSYYSTCLEGTVKELTTLMDSYKVKSKDPDLAAEAIERMKELIALLKAMFSLTKENDSLAKKNVLLQQLKFGSRFIETFVSKAMPFFQLHFERHDDAILDVIGSLQKWSRQLYYIMAHGKRGKDAILNREAPRAKKALETFVHKVKALLKKNGCLTAMWTQTLKAKDIDGTRLKEEKGKSQDTEEDEEEGDSDSDDDEEKEDGSEKDEDGDDNDGAGTDEDDYETDDSD